MAKQKPHKCGSRNFPTYPWNIPQTRNQQFMVRNSFHLGVKGEAWGLGYAPEVCWGSLGVVLWGALKKHIAEVYLPQLTNWNMSLMIFQALFLMNLSLNNFLVSLKQPFINRCFRFQVIVSTGFLLNKLCFFFQLQSSNPYKITETPPATPRKSTLRLNQQTSGDGLFGIGDYITQLIIWATD